MTKPSEAPWTNELIIDAIASRHNVDYKIALQDIIGTDYEIIPMQLWSDMARQNGYKVNDASDVLDSFSSLFKQYKAKQDEQ